MTTRERNMLIFLGVVALGALLYFVFFLGGGEPEQDAAPTTPVASPPPIPPTPGTGVGEPPEEDQPPRAVAFFGGRDPFVPLVVAVAPTPSPGVDGGGEPPPDDGEPDDGEPGDGEPPIVEPPDDAEEEEQDGITVTGKQVVLVDVIDSNTVQVEVEGRPYTVSEGETFAENFEVVSVEGGCARFLFGDESFTLCEGEAPK